jgi:ATP-dependent Clp protease ATP-binding subunit ClpC
MSDNIEELRKIYVSVLDKHMKPQLKMDNAQFNDELIKAIEESKNEAEKLGSPIIGTEHLLLAILNKENGFSETEVFDKFRLEYDFIFNKCNISIDNKKQIKETKQKKLQTKKISNKKNNMPLKSEVNTKIISTNSSNEFVEQYTTSLNKLALDGKIDEIVGREQEINEIIKVLSRRKKNNAVLVGEGGCGKTAIVYGIANMIVNGDVPEILDGKEIVMLNPMALVSGTHFRGMFEERINGLFTELKKSSKYILFIDDIHTVLKNGSKEKDTDISGMIGEALSEGSIKIIGATTFKDYRNSIESNSSLSRKFQKIIIDPVSNAEAVKILTNNKRYYEEYHNVQYTEKAIKKAVDLAERYITDRTLPDSAFDIIDLAGANTSLIDREPIEIQNIKKRIKEIQNEKENSLNNGDFEKIDVLNAEENVLNADVADYRRSNHKNSIEQIVINEDTISNVVSEITKIPV